MQPLSFQSITTDPVSDPMFREKNIEVSVLRTDKIHPVISGNKWFKLQFYLQEAKELKKTTLVTFGGAWSNHIVATAAACKMNTFNSIGIIRGEEPQILSNTLSAAKDYGMRFCFLTRTDYKNKPVPSELKNPDNYFIPEGGYGEKGAEGAATILNYCQKDKFTHICCAVGTGTMLAGLARASLKQQEVIGISIMKNNFALEHQVSALLPFQKKFQLIHEYHFGGYAKYNEVLINFMNCFYQRNQIPSDFVYSGKLFFAVNNLIEKNFFQPGSKILVIHCGGLQGNSSLPKGTLMF